MRTEQDARRDPRPGDVVPGPRIVCTGCQSPQAVFRREIGTFLCDECWDSLAMLGIAQEGGDQ